MLLTKAQILSADDRKFEDVPCPEWGGDVRIGNISGLERDSFELDNFRSKDTTNRNFRAKLVALCAIDEAGNKLFTEEDVTALGQKNAAPLDRLFDAARRVNDMKQGDVEEAAKN